MQQKVSMSSLAKMFNVSKVTISKALNDKEGVSEELRSQIKKAAEEMGYRINNAARGLRTNKMYNIGLLIAERYMGKTNSYYFGVCGKMVARLAELNYSSIMETLTDKMENELVLPMMYTDHKIDGLIIIGQLKNEYLRLFHDFDIPFIFFDFYVNEGNIPSIVIDNFYSGYAVTNLLVANGHKEIGFVGNIMTTSSIQDRFLGFYRSLLEHRLTVNYDYLISDRNDDGHLIDLVLPEKLPTAYVCNNDEVAFRLVQALNEQGIRVPEDVSIVTFDNTIYSTLSTPALTTVDNNVDEEINVACKVIMKKISNPSKVYDRILIKSFIIERDSIKKLN
jgi:LacI family transcriptional regulator